MRQESSQTNQDNPRRGRPVQENRNIVSDGYWEIDIPNVQYFSEFGIEDGLAFQDDQEEGSRKSLIQNIYKPHKESIEKMRPSLNDLKDDDIITFIDYASKSVDILCCKQYCELMILVFKSLSVGNHEQIEEMASSFLEGSDFYSFEVFKQAMQFKDKRRNKKQLNPIQQKVLQKILKNQRNEKKKYKRNQKEIFIPKIEDIFDQQKIQKCFSSLFLQLRTQIANFVSKPQPFLSEYRLMEKCLLEIMGAMQQEKQ